MSIFRNLFGPPDVDRLEETKDVKGLIKALEYAKDSQIQYWAARALETIGDARAVEPLMNAFTVGDDEVRQAAASALGEIGGTQAVDLLIGGLKDKHKYVRSAAAHALGEIGDKRALEPLERSLKDEHERVRSSAARALGKIGDAQASESLEGALKDQSKVVRYEATMALGKIGDPRAVDPLIKFLKIGKDNERKNAAQILGEIKDPRAIEPLIAALLDRDYKVTNTVEQALVEIGSATVAPLINAIKTGALKKEFTDVSHRAEAILAEIDKPAVEPLKDLLKDKSWKARKIAARALKKIGWSVDDDALSAVYFIAIDEQESYAKIGPAGVEPLIDALINGDDGIRRSAATALGKIGESSAVEALTISLEGENEDVRVFSAQALGDIGDPEAVESLLTLLDDDLWRIRRAAAGALGKIGDTRAVNPLSNVLKDGDWDVREAAAMALEKMGVPSDKGWAKVDIRKLKVCAKCSRSEQRIRSDFEEAKRRGVVVIGNGDVLYYCANCEKSFCGRCQVDLYVAVGCPICENRLQPASKIIKLQ
jgi:HEAT repeat protein